VSTRVIALLWARGEASAETTAALRSALDAACAELGSVQHQHLGRHLPGAIGGGDYTWDVLLDATQPTRLLESEALQRLQSDDGLLSRVDAVAFPGGNTVTPEPDIANPIKRTLLLRVRPQTPRALTERFEKILLDMPRHIGAIRNYALNRTDASLWRTPWTHVWEQEYAEVAGLEVDYMVHPYHWGVVDGWFDPECPQSIVEPALAHVYCPASESILSW
jgi:hypothetical protein